MKDERAKALLELRRNAQALGFNLLLLRDMFGADGIEPVHVVKTYGIYVSTCYVPLDDFCNQVIKQEGQSNE